MANENQAVWNRPKDAATEAEWEAAWAAWIDDPERPEPMRVVARRFKPWLVYRLKTTGQACELVSFGEAEDDGRILIRANCQHPVLGEISLVQVFGLEPDDFEPWPANEPFEGMRMTVLPARRL